jgi:hypothetical protein
MAVLQATKLDLKNFSLLVSHALVPPAIRDLLGSPKKSRRGIHCAGACLHRYRLPGIFGVGAMVPRADRAAAY